MILIGSRALKLRADYLLERAPLDFDFMSSMEEYQLFLDKNADKISITKTYSLSNGKKMIIEGKTNCEFEIIQETGSSAIFESLVKNDKDTFETPFGLVPNLDLLFTLKSSHKYLKNSPHFWKTLVDYHRMKQVGAKVRPEYQEFFKLREKETYTYSHPKLNQSKDGFFADDGLTYVFDHDCIHESVALNEKPAYTYYLKDGEQVQCDKNKFFACDRSIQLAGVVEEAAVLAIERSLVPHPGVWTPKYAWHFALSKVCSSITSGWFRAFAYDNAFEIMKMYPEKYWDKFQEDITKGLIKPFTKGY